MFTAGRHCQFVWVWVCVCVNCCIGPLQCSQTYANCKTPRANLSSGAQSLASRMLTSQRLPRLACSLASRDANSVAALLMLIRTETLTFCRQCDFVFKGLVNSCNTCLCSPGDNLHQRLALALAPLAIDD